MVDKMLFLLLDFLFPYLNICKNSKKIVRVPENFRSLIYSRISDLVIDSVELVRAPEELVPCGEFLGSAASPGSLRVRFSLAGKDKQHIIPFSFCLKR